MQWPPTRPGRKARRLQHFQRIDADLVEDDRQFVHQRDIQVALGVFDDLGRFRHLDGGGAVNTGSHDRLIQFSNCFERCRIIAGHHFQDGGQAVLLVARVDALRGVADVEILRPLQAGQLFQHRDADFLGGAGIHRRFVHDDGALLHVLADRGRSAHQRPEVGRVGIVDRRRDRYHNVIGLGQRGRVVGDVQLGCFAQFRFRHFAGRVAELAVILNLGLGQVETDGLAFLTELYRQGQAHITEAYDCYNLIVIHIRFP